MPSGIQFAPRAGSFRPAVHGMPLPVILSDGVHTSVYRVAPCNRSAKLPCVKTAAGALLILTEHHRTALCQRHIQLKGACIRIDTVDIASRHVCGTAPCDRKGLWLRVRQRVGVEVWGVIRPLSQNMQVTIGKRLK